MRGATAARRRAMDGTHADLGGTYYSPRVQHYAQRLVYRVSRMAAATTQDSSREADPGARSIIGPIIGGALARPCKFYPGIFPPQAASGSGFRTCFPTCSAPWPCCLASVVGFLFLEETHLEKKHQPDRGLEMGKRLLERLRWRSSAKREEQRLEEQRLQEERPLLDADEPLPVYRSTENSPELVSVSGPDPDQPLELAAPAVAPARRPIDSSRRVSNKLFTRNVVLNILTYGILALCVPPLPLFFPASPS